MTDMRELAAEHGLTEEEYDHVLEVLGREPTITELGIVSVMWSEHCSYKSSRVHLSTLPTKGPQVVQGPGENAGAVDIGDGLAAVFKMESHNHPSFIEPYQGAATGVGGILRDVFTMGARPVASLNSLRFGRIDNEKTPHLFWGVVGGIAGYGNCVGVPTVGGEVYFDPCYDGNILVNAFTVGICPKDAIFKGIAAGVGNPVFYVGAGTGRDGIHGATMASEQFEEGSDEKRPTVQVGDPFREKLLIEACLELMQTGAIIGIQDMGAAGLTSSSVEMADRGGVGIQLDIDKVPMREEGMTAYEVMLSESQERMLIVIREGREDEVGRVFEKWELEWAQVGAVIEEPVLEILRHGQVQARLPVGLLTSEAPKYDRPRRRPAYLDRLEMPDLPAPSSIEGAFVQLLGSPNIGSRRMIWEQYDHMVGVGTVLNPGEGDAAVVRIPGTDRAIALAVDCNSRKCFIDPREGARHAVAECSRNVACVGARPLGTTDCLNFGDPTNPEIMWQFAEAVAGMGEACEALDVPIVSGNVSLYNASFGKDIYPTPTVAVVGAFEQKLGRESDGPAGFAQTRFRAAGDRVMVLGKTDPKALAASEYLWLRTGKVGAGLPRLDLDVERRLQKLVRELVARRLVQSAHDCAEGGLGVAFVEGLLGTSLGLELTTTWPDRPDEWLFSESPSRIVVSCRPEDEEAVAKAATAAGISWTIWGTVTDRRRLTWGEALDLDLVEAERAHAGALDPLS